nr:hypothetical protein [Candidatus Gracilibacteria bacterium]
MEYKDRAKTRKFKRQLLQIIDLIKLKGLNLSTSRKIILAGILVGFISLFLNWSDSTSVTSNNIENSFSDLVGRTGITLIIIQALILFLTFSKKNKDKIKISTDLHIKDFTLVIIAGIFTIIVSINALNFINGLQRFSSDIILGTGIISEICAGIIVTVGGILLRSEFYKNRNQVYINESEEEIIDDGTIEKVDENNMSLPF